jgi:Na+-translocating ferredoxin:NAD+ oxidoreductase RnfD subunit
MHTKKLAKDARNFQLLFQLIFLAYGVVALQWGAQWVIWLLYAGGGLFFQWLLLLCTPGGAAKLFWQSGQWKSVMISCLSLCLLLKTNSAAMALLAAAVVVLGKKYITWRGAHVFNPSALAIVIAVSIGGAAWISPGQWGAQAVLVFAVATLGTIVTLRVQHLAISIAFALGYAALCWCRQVLYLGWPADYFLQSVSTGSLLLFAFFMLSEPKTSPHHPHLRMGWALGVAALSFYLSQFWYVNGAPIWALVVTQPLVPLLNSWRQGALFHWQSAASATPAITHLSIQK